MRMLARPVSVYISACAMESAAFSHHSRIGGISFTPLGIRNDAIIVERNSVENCSCKTGYSGLSCEKCQRGFYRSSTNSFSSCIRCNCNSHASDCNEKSGVCVDCQHNTFGDSCEFCMPGYYGNATLGGINVCKACPCQAPFTETNLCAQSSVTGNVTCLNCSDGYTGNLCSECADGFYRNNNGYCVPCECNNNSKQCDKATGQCIDCRFNTTGNSCERCKDSWFGNARNQSCKGIRAF